MDFLCDISRIWKRKEHNPPVRRNKKKSCQRCMKMWRLNRRQANWLMCVCMCVCMAGCWWGCGMAHLHAPPAPSHQLRPTLPYTPIPINTHGTIWFIQNTSERMVRNAASIRSNLSAGSSGLMGYHPAQSGNAVHKREASELLERVHTAKGDLKNCQHCANA